MKKFDLIDFDKKSKEYISQWISRQLQDGGKTPEQLEAEAPGVYARWSREQSKYFNGFSGGELVEMLAAYMASDISVPDILCDKIIEQKKDTEEPLYRFFQQDILSAENRMLVINMLSAMESLLPLGDLIRMVRENDGDKELINAAAEALCYMKGEASEALLEAFDRSADQTARELFMHAIVYKNTCPAGLAGRLNDLLSASTSKAYVAGLMAQYGDDDCLPALYAAEKSAEIDYIDYTEICNAIEALGGATERSRSFEGDAYYDMLKSYALNEN